MQFYTETLTSQKPFDFYLYDVIYVKANIDSLVFYFSRKSSKYVVNKNPEIHTV